MSHFYLAQKLRKETYASKPVNHMVSTKLHAAIGKTLYDNASIIKLKNISFNPRVLI